MTSTGTKMKNTENYVVAIGASAGGLEAIHEFFDNMPANGNLSFIIIQHLSPDYKSLLVELISKHTNMEVFEADHQLEVKGNTVYVIPNNKLLTIRDGRLHLEAKSGDKAPNTAIDTLLHSLAKDQGQRAVAIILSGTGSDGSRGIKEINAAGGLVMVQDPLTAKFDGMPNSAIATGVADLILSPELMPEEIFNYINEKPERIPINGKPDEESLAEVLRLVELHCQQDFNNYKSATILRRIARRMGLLGYENFEEYLNLLNNSAEECRFLGKEFLIGVTKFFRDRTAFNILREEVLYPMVREKKDSEILKVWVTACSTGEEAYSIAILIDQLLHEAGKNLDVKIFASDIDEEAIEFASRATYDAASLRDMDPDILSNYFVEERGKYAIIPRIRKQIVFAKHNILKDPPFIKNDLISCRNMLIYMDSILQRKVISIFQFSLNTGGCLFLGPSESPINIKNGFREVNGKWKIFRKVFSGESYNPEGMPSSSLYRSSREKLVRPVTRENNMIRDLTDDMKSLLTSKYKFAALYIDDNTFEVKEAVGDFNKYLSLPERISSLNILRMVGKELSVALNAAIRKSVKENREIELTGMRVQQNAPPVNIFVQPSSKNGMVLLVLGEYHDAVQPKVSVDPSLIEEGSAASYIGDLEEELKETRANLQMAVESLETANEELQSSNEELLSANEELQSSNEELQSLNEELHTLNTEHQLRIKELVELNDDLNNYFRSTEIAQVFVDSDFRIRKFNPSAVRMINLIEGDIGRPIIHISTNILNNNNFVEDIHSVMKTNKIIEKEVKLSNGKVHLMRILPFLRQDESVDGVVITFVDISSLKELNTIIQSVFDATFSAVMAFRAVRNQASETTDLIWVAANYASDELLHRQGKEYMGKSVKSLFPQLLKNGFLKKCSEVMDSGQPYHSEIQLQQNEITDWYSVIVTSMVDGVVVNLTNINDKKQAEEKIRHNYQELVRSREKYRELNLELEQKVRERTFELSQSEERFRLISTAMSDAIWDRDLVNDKIWWSDSFYNWFGYGKDADSETVEFWMDKIHPADKELVKKALSDSINNGRDWTIQYRLRKIDGEYIPIEDKGTVLKNENDIPYRLLGAIRDRSSEEIAKQNEALKATNLELEEIVQQRTADVELQKSILQNLFMQAPAMICTLSGKDHVYELVNPLYQNLFGKRELTGKPVLEALPELKGQGIQEILDSVYNTGETYIGTEVPIFISRDVNKAQEEIYITFIYQATRGESGQINGILVFAYEVTDQVRARKAVQDANDELVKLNQEIRFVTDFMPQMVWATRPDGHHYFYNKGWYEYTGLPHLDQLAESSITGEEWANVVYPEDRERSKKTWQESVNSGTNYEIEYRLRRHDGEYRWFLGRALPLKDESGNIIKWFGTCTDIHDQKLMSDILEQKVDERTRELQKINAELELSNNELLQFASIASHDLKEPLRKIILFSNLLRDRYTAELTEGGKEYINKIIASSSRMGVLVQDLLSFTKLSVASAFEKIDLNTIIDEVLSDLELTIKEKNAEILVNDLPEAEIVPGQMRQVFQNIISNALKFSKKDVRPQIKISAVRVASLSFVDSHDDNGKFCRISIEDNGIGFEEEYSDKIFTIFQRLHTRKKYEGTGIGLAIARKIIAKHNGIVKATGKEGVGACFTLVIPMEQAEEQTDEPSFSIGQSRFQ